LAKKTEGQKSRDTVPLTNLKKETAATINEVNLYTFLLLHTVHNFENKKSSSLHAQ
jgi:hypothetical protein